MIRILASILVLLAMALPMVSTAPVKLEEMEFHHVLQHGWMCIGDTNVRKCIEGVSRPVAMEKIRVRMVCSRGGVIGPPKVLYDNVEQPTACKAI